MRFPNNSRRKFLFKSTLVFGLVPFVKSVALVGNSVSRTVPVRIFHDINTFQNSLIKESNLLLDEFHNVLLDKVKIWFLGNEKGSSGNDGRVYLLSTSFFGRDQAEIPIGELEEKYWINSNLVFEKSLLPEKVSQYG